MASVVVGNGVVVTIQGSVIGEKDQGTAEWVMSKPVSRASFVMWKIVAHSFGFLVTAVLIPASIYAVISTAQSPACSITGTTPSQSPLRRCRHCSMWH
jgi:ABC-2 type transport system permease protein